MPIALTALYWYALAFTFACLEIEAEGRYGWAEKLPTWYRTKGMAAKIYGLFMNDKPLTGYHCFVLSLFALIFHIPYIEGKPWSFSSELMTWAVFLAWCQMEDFLWFILNPYYTIKGFRKVRVWWHSRSPWILGLIPLDYVLGWVTSLGLSAIAAFALDHRPEIFIDHARLVGTFIGLTVATIIPAPLYHRWYKSMREREDRDSAPIKHEN